MRTTSFAFVLAAALLPGTCPPCAAEGEPATNPATPPSSRETIRWADRVIPLPKGMSVAGSVKLPASQVSVHCDVQASPPIKTAIGLLRSFALGNEKSDGFVIRLGLSEAAASGVGWRTCPRCPWTSWPPW